MTTTHHPHFGMLTARECQVVRLLASGLSNKRIALALGLSDHTVKTHVGNALTKLDAENRVALAVEAIRRGMVAAPTPPSESADWLRY